VSNVARVPFSQTKSPAHQTASNRLSEPQCGSIEVPQHMQELVPGILQAIYLGGRYLASLLPPPFSPLFESAICHYYKPTHHHHAREIILILPLSLLTSHNKWCMPESNVRSGANPRSLASVNAPRRSGLRAVKLLYDVFLWNISK
jgi:hypothetical protein